jgi:hypothetical protein
MSSVKKGYDFKYCGARYQVKGNRPRGKPGSFVTLVPKVRNYEWDFLIWILYNPRYEIQEAWLWKFRLTRQHSMPTNVFPLRIIEMKASKNSYIIILRLSAANCGGSSIL